MFPTLYTVTRNGVVYKYATAFRHVFKRVWPVSPDEFLTMVVRQLRSRWATVVVTPQWHARQHARTRRTPLYPGR